MSEIKLTASAWIPEEPTHVIHFDRETYDQSRWKVRAEVSATDALGKPLSSLPDRVWSVHVTDASGETHAPSFTVVRASVSGQVIPGFYVLTVNDLLTIYLVAPTAFGVVVDRKGAHGQLRRADRHRGPVGRLAARTAHRDRGGPGLEPSLQNRAETRGAYDGAWG